MDKNSEKCKNSYEKNVTAGMSYCMLRLRVRKLDQC